MKIQIVISGSDYKKARNFRLAIMELLKTHQPLVVQFMRWLRTVKLDIQQSCQHFIRTQIL